MFVIKKIHYINSHQIKFLTQNIFNSTVIITNVFIYFVI